MSEIYNCKPQFSSMGHVSSFASINYEHILWYERKDSVLNEIKDLIHVVRKYDTMTILNYRPRDSVIKSNCLANKKW